MGAGHSHGERPSLGPAPRQIRVLMAALVAPLVLATLVGLVTLWPDGDLEVSGPGVDVERGTAEVQSVGPCRQQVEGCQLAQVELLSGPGAPGEAEALLPYGSQAPEVVAGDRIIVSFTEQAPDGEQYAFQDFDRGPPLLVLLILFAVAVLALSRWRGIGALASLAYSLILIAGFTLPAIMEGASPLLVAVTTAAAIMLVTLYLSHGFTVRTTVAMLGTLVSLVVIGGVGWVFTEVGHFTGLVDEGSQYISGIAAQVDLRGLLLAGLVIGALGVLDDVTVTQTWAVWELADVDPDASTRSLFIRAMRIGRSHAASTVNTLVLAYVGATLPLMLVFSALSLPFGVAVSQEVVAQEVVRGLVGGLGIIAAVPVTTAIAAVVAGRLLRERTHAGAPSHPTAPRLPRVHQPTRLVVLVSGSGTNLQALLDACADPSYGARVVAVGADREDIEGLARAERAGIPTFVRQVSDFETREGWDASLTTVVERFEPDLVVSAGFMKLLSTEFLDRFLTLNTHPALCPAFPGMHGPRDALEHGVKVTGATLFVVDAGVDTGPIVAQVPVEVAEDDDVASLHERIKTAERAMLVDAVGRIAREGIAVEGRRVRIGAAAR